MENPQAENLRAADYETAIGPNVEYYLPRIEQLDAGGSRIGWHWPAFFATTPWFLYRRMWPVGILNLVYPFALTFFCSIAFAFLIGAVGANPVICVVIYLVLLAAPWFVLPMFANALYWRHVGELIDRMPRAYAQDPERKFARLQRDGGTGPGAMLAACAVMGVLSLSIVGVMAAIAIPAYRDYAIRAQVSEGLTLAGPAKAQVAEFYAKHGSWPDQADLDGEMPSGKYVRSVGVAAGSVVITYGNGAHADLAAERLLLVPGVDASGEIHWSCGDHPAAAGVTPANGPSGSDLPAKYLPAYCGNDGSNADGP
jgi:type IV pilus assembly protein PilA